MDSVSERKVYRHAMEPYKETIADFIDAYGEGNIDYYGESLKILQENGEEKLAKLIEGTMNKYFRQLNGYLDLPYEDRKFHNRMDVLLFIAKTIRVVVKQIKRLATACVRIHQRKMSEGMEPSKIDYWWFTIDEDEDTKGDERMKDFVAQYFIQANYFYIQFLLVDVAILAALPVTCSEYELSEDFVPLHAMVLTRDFKVFDDMLIDQLCQDSTFLRYLCAIGFSTCGDVMKLSNHDATNIFAYGYNEAQRVEDDGIHVDDDDIHHHEESLPLHRVLHALLDVKEHMPENSYEICVVLAGMIQCGCDPHLPNTRMETALQLASKIDGVVFSYMIRREIVDEMKMIKHNDVVSEIGKQVKSGFFGDEEVIDESLRIQKKSQRRRKKIKNNKTERKVNNNGGGGGGSDLDDLEEGEFVSRAEFNALKRQMKKSRKKFSKILMMFSKMMDLNDSSTNQTNSNNSVNSNTNQQVYPKKKGRGGIVANKLEMKNKTITKNKKKVPVNNNESKEISKQDNNKGKEENNISMIAKDDTVSNKNIIKKTHSSNHEDYRELKQNDGEEFDYGTDSSTDDLAGLSDELSLSADSD